MYLNVEKCPCDVVLSVYHLLQSLDSLMGFLKSPAETSSLNLMSSFSCVLMDPGTKGRRDNVGHPSVSRLIVQLEAAPLVILFRDSW